MRQSSDTIGSLAAALAIAQAELINPEKTLSATIVSPFPREASRTFRYASLSTGLELVRKCLGRHEIATVQSTAVEKDSGLICLTTTLIHASGEWVSSDWPVCPVSETATPHRLGAALTYARRYALFTLVGIAGEDDLDAPDLSSSSALPANTQEPLPQQTKSETISKVSFVKHSRDQRAKATIKPPILAPKASEDLSQQLLRELQELSDSTALANWAQRALPLKNQLASKEVGLVEAAFASKLLELGEENLASVHQSETQTPKASPTEKALPIHKPFRERDRQHLQFVAGQPCLVCGRTPTDAHHLKFAQLRALGRKVSDKFTVPVCRAHHRALHRRGDERVWWQEEGIDPLPVAAELWGKTHGHDSIQGSPGDASKIDGVGGRLSDTLSQAQRTSDDGRSEAI
jgi:hypothetical protein